MTRGLLTGRSAATDRAARRAAWVVYGSASSSSPWLTEHNLAAALARTGDVLFVEPPISVLSPIRWTTTWRELAGSGRLRRRDPATPFDRVQPLTLPFVKAGVSRRLSRPLVAMQIRRAMRRLGLRSPAAVFATAQVELFGIARESTSILLVKDLNESRPDLFRRSTQTMRDELEASTTCADIVVVISEALRSTLAQRHVDSHVVLHGFDATLIGRDPDRRPGELPPSASPLMVYAGRIDARLDFRALEELARVNADGHIVMLGPVSPFLDERQIAGLRGLANVHFVGQVGRETVYDCLRHADVGLLPYVADDWGRHGSPLKVWDYLGSGVAVAGTGYEALAGFDERLVTYERESSRLVAVVAAALSSDAPERRRERMAFAVANSWDARAGELAALVREQTKFETEVPAG